MPSIGEGILADFWRAEERGKSLSLYYIFPLISPAVGPILGSFVVEYSIWRWMFHITSIASAFVQAIGLLVFSETYGSKILQKKASQLRKAQGNPNLHTGFEQRHGDVAAVLARAFIHPCRLLGTQPIIQALAAFTAYVYGLMCLALSTYSEVWVDIYGERPDIAGLNYISLAIGFSLGTQICSAYQRLRKSSNLYVRVFIEDPVNLKNAESTKQQCWVA